MHQQVQTRGSIYQCSTRRAQTGSFAAVVQVPLSLQYGSHFGSSWHYGKHLIIF